MAMQELLKLMIVEDEPLARTAILKIIDFAACGFEIVAVCEDGQEAIDQYFRLQPDLVITDICMPLVSGLELAARIAAAGRGTRVIIITGYDDFNYARTAISSQVSDYILKPVTAREFIEVLGNARKAIDEQKARREQIESAQRMIHITSPLVRDQLMNRLIQGTAEIRTIIGEARSYGLDSDQAYYQIVLEQIDNPREAIRQLNVDHELLNLMIANIIAELTAVIPGALTFSLTDGRTAIMGSGGNAPELDQNLRSLSAQARDTIQHLLKTAVTFGIGKTVPSLSAVRESYQTAARCLDYKFLLPSRSVIAPEDIRQQDIQVDFSPIEEQILQQVRLQDESQVRELIEKIIRAWRLTCHSLADFQYACSRLVSRLLSVTRTEGDLVGPDLDSTLPAGDDLDYLPRLQDWLIQFCHSCAEYLRTGRQGSARRLTAMALQYIRDHYAESSLSLMELCSHLAVSMSYFSSFFKDETGKTFIEYLTDLRMDKAKDLLLNSDLMLYIIAERVGYDNPAYFTVAFKKNTGMKPKEFRKAFGRKE